MEDLYYVISNSDGDTNIKTCTRIELMENLNEDYWGEGIEFIKTFESNEDSNYWGGNKIAIIKGSIIIPKEEISYIV